MTTLNDLLLRISMVVAHFLLACRVPLPGFTDSGPFAGFHDASRVEARHRFARGELMTVGGVA